jgi:bacteriorhodopsin
MRSSKLASWYIFLSVYLMVLFCLYPIVWGLAEGSNTIAIVAEVGGWAGCWEGTEGHEGQQ